MLYKGKEIWMDLDRKPDKHNKTDVKRNRDKLANRVALIKSIQKNETHDECAIEPDIQRNDSNMMIYSEQ